MLTIQILLIISSLVALAAGIPQMIKLVKTKNSDEFNLGTWSMWIGTQSVSTVYALSIGDLLLLCINFSWVLFYLSMAALIVKYDPNRKIKLLNRKLQNIQTESPLSDSVV